MQWQISIIVLLTLLFNCLAFSQVPVAQEQPAKTAVCSRSCTKVDDTHAAPGSMLLVHGVQLLQVMMLIKCGAIVKDMEVSKNFR